MNNEPNRDAFASHVAGGCMIATVLALILVGAVLGALHAVGVL